MKYVKKKKKKKEEEQRQEWSVKKTRERERERGREREREKNTQPVEMKFRRIPRSRIPLTNVFVYKSHQDIMIDCNFVHSYATKPVRPVD